MNRVSLCALLLVLFCGFSAAQQEKPQQEKVLFTFPANHSRGWNPYGNLVFDRAGNLYGTTSEGGTFNGGVVFQLSQESNGSWTQTVLYNFCSAGNSYCSDGWSPQSGLTIDSQGNLYGTTVYGGRPCKILSYEPSCGTVFELSPPSTPGGAWNEQVLYSFCATGGEAKCADGAFPTGPLVFDNAGNLYGETNMGGQGRNSGGTVFELSPNSSGWKEQVLHNFCSEGSAPFCPDGLNPWGGVIFDQSGNLYGTVTAGGFDDQKGNGAVFKLAPGAAQWTESVLLAFPGIQDQFPGPEGGVALSADGYLYGTIGFGGEYGVGGVFRLAVGGGTPEYFWFDEAQGDPQTQILIDAKQNVLYGTTPAGGADLYGFGGTVFQLDLSMAVQSTLYSFCSLPQCADGQQPEGPVVEDQTGNLYGMTYLGNTVYEIEMPQ
jgi:hypothetical protein